MDRRATQGLVAEVLGDPCEPLVERGDVAELIEARPRDELRVLEHVVGVLLAEDRAGDGAHAGPRAVEPRVELAYREGWVLGPDQLHLHSTLIGPDALGPRSVTEPIRSAECWGQCSVRVPA